MKKNVGSTSRVPPGPRVIWLPPSILAAIVSCCCAPVAVRRERGGSVRNSARRVPVGKITFLRAAAYQQIVLLAVIPFRRGGGRAPGFGFGTSGISGII